MKLTRQERKEILAGDRRALRRKQDPKVKNGEVIVLAWSRGGKQILSRDEREIEKRLAGGQPITAEIPRKPTVWLELRESVRHKDGDWLIQFEVRDEREPIRTLGAIPGPRSEAGLKTRWRPPGEVPKRGEQEESWTEEAARGYGGTGVDEREGVDDETLKRFAVEGKARLAEHRESARAEAAAAAQARQVVNKLRRLQSEAARYKVDLTPRFLAMIRQAEQEIVAGRIASA